MSEHECVVPDGLIGWREVETLEEYQRKRTRYTEDGGAVDMVFDPTCRICGAAWVNIHPREGMWMHADDFAELNARRREK